MIKTHCVHEGNYQGTHVVRISSISKMTSKTKRFVFLESLGSDLPWNYDNQLPSCQNRV